MITGWCNSISRLMNYKHGMCPNNGKQHPVLTAYWQMHARCCNPKCERYPHYGGRGITICERWKASFANFKADMLPTWKRGLSLDRIDNDGPYRPKNCRWATRKQQMRNRTCNHWIDTPLWGRITLVEVAERTGIQRDTLRARLLVYGYSVEQALSKPVGRWIK